MTRTRFALSALALLVLLGGPALAHHGWGSYDTSKPLTITGPVEKLEWANPHVEIALKHEGATWKAVLAPISRMTARGLSEEMLKVGTTVSVRGYPSTHEAYEMRAEQITVGDTTFELR